MVGSQLLFLERNSCDVLLRGPIYLGIEMTLTISCGYERNIFEVPLDSHKLTFRERKFRGNKHVFNKACLQKQGNRLSCFIFYSLWLSKRKLLYDSIINILPILKSPYRTIKNMLKRLKINILCFLIPATLCCSSTPNRLQTYTQSLKINKKVATIIANRHIHKNE